MKQILSQIIDKVSRMPNVSPRTHQLISLLMDDNWSMNEVVEIVESDVSLTARCLHLVNSAAYGLRNEVKSVRHAVNLLGSRTLLSIIFREDFNKYFTVSMKGYEAREGEFWDHSLRTAIAARNVARELWPEVQADVTYTAALIHDIGKAIISEFLEKSNQDIIHERLTNSKGDFLSIENEVLGVDHSVVGEAMAESWKFPEPLRMAIRYHHYPDQAPPEYQSLAVAVHVGDILAMLGGSGTGKDALDYSINPLATDMLKINKKKLAYLIFQIDMEYLEIQNKLFGESK